MQQSGKFIVSLDFELLWGMRDHESIESYGENILGVREVLPKMLELFESYGIRSTFATVGILFSSNKDELLSFLPKEKPNYFHKVLSPYGEYINEIKSTEKEDKYHYAEELIELIKEYPNQEIATHTFSHYYCLERGQTIKEFKADLKSAIRIAKKKNVRLKSIIFPRNQFNENYLKVCAELGILSYRGNEDVWFNRASSGGNETIFKRFFRLLDSYINISGHHSYAIADIEKQLPINIPSSRFLRPYYPKFAVIEKLKLNRILNGMSYAAEHGEVYHLWWHPHNFGKNIDQNLKILIQILQHYKNLNLKNSFESLTMNELLERVKVNNN